MRKHRLGEWGSGLPPRGNGGHSGVPPGKGILERHKGMLPIGQSSFMESSDFSIVGSGNAQNSCGVWFTKGCLNVEGHRGMTLDGVDMEGKAFLRRVQNSCDRPLCPTCWEKWVGRETKRAVQRLEAFVLKGRHLKAIHVVVSVPKVHYGLSFVEMRKNVYRALKRVRCVGGLMIYHPRRWNFQGSYFSPHFHVVGYGWIVDARANFMNTGYVIRNVGKRKTLGGTIRYLLSHCGISAKHHSVTWFGALSYGKLHVVYEKEHCTCSVCGNKLRRLCYVGTAPLNLPDVEGAVFIDDAVRWIYDPRPPGSSEDVEVYLDRISYLEESRLDRQRCFPRKKRAFWGDH